MAERGNPVVRKSAFLTNARAKELAADGVQEAVRNGGKERLAKACDKQVRTVEKWMGQASLPGIDDLLNMADEDPAVARALFAEKGWILTPAKAAPANDMELAAGLGRTLAEYLDRMRDGRRCHLDTATLAKLFRDLIPGMQAIVDEDDARRMSA